MPRFWPPLSFTLGTVGLTDDGQVNRDGIGAVVLFTPEGKQTVIQPILGGSSFLSQDSLAANFGLNTAESGMVEVLWPGGVRNRLYDVEAGERIIFPEFPGNFQGDFSSLNYYETQVKQAIDELVISGTLIEAEGNRFLDSSIRAFKKENGIDGGNGGVGPDADVVGPGGDDTLTGDNFSSGQGADTFAFATFYQHYPTMLEDAHNVLVFLRTEYFWGNNRISRICGEERCVFVATIDARL